MTEAYVPVNGDTAARQKAGHYAVPVPVWSAEVTVDAGLVRRLIAGQFPQLELRSLRLMAEGWDNAVWLVDERWAFRFPRRSIAILGVRREIAVLPELAPLLPLPIPVPRFVGEPAHGYPWPFFGAALLPGRELPDAGLTDDERCALGRPLGEFLRTLHRVDVAAGLPSDPLERSDMAVRVPRTLERLAELEPLWRAPPSVRDLLDAARGLPVPEPVSVVHGDLHFRHLLVEGGAAAGVIDWGDLCRDDPSVDLPLYWCALPPDGRADFRAAYGPLTDEQLLRARVLAIFLCAVLALYGTHEGMDSVKREALAGLDRALANATAHHASPP
jgi:aminoglycoside phosphotransferase (APT) family kinase protein